jgi:hypothetical protein
MTEQKRRMSDHLPLDIEAMIIAEPDAKQRAFLIVLNAINVSLVANTTTIRDVSTKLEAHLTSFEKHTVKEEALMNKGRGMWKIAAWVIGAAQVVGVAVWTDARTDLGSIHTSITSLVAKDAAIETRVTVLEKTK